VRVAATSGATQTDQENLELEILGSSHDPRALVLLDKVSMVSETLDL
jgi:hypothetical protein